ncbi:hypothetical protein BGZ83_004816 [Gryganskiella cystojenkinii]|nr:hypothetical protein BGZ83_004816 [Gryganskiella cystojenkinii]
MASQTPQDGNENQSLTQDAFDLLIRSNMTYKERSHTTCQETHLPELQSTSTIDTVLIGDSMLERFKTTGTATQVSTNLPRSFNAGCGGDKIENVLYRLSFMNPLLQEKQVKLWVVMLGTNNLRNKKGLKPTDRELYRLLLQNLLRVGATESKILICELFKRKDFEDRHIDDANTMIRSVIQEMNTDSGKERIFLSEAPEEITKTEEHLDDHVHLNEEGYRIWDEVLFPRIQTKLQESSQIAKKTHNNQ